MHIDSIKEKVYLVWYSIGVLFLFAIIMWILSIFKSLVALLTVCILIAYLLVPMVNYLTHPISLKLPSEIKVGGRRLRIPFKFHFTTKKGVSRLVSITLVFIFVGILLMLIMLYVVPIVTQEFNNLNANRNAYYQSAIKWINDAQTWLMLNTPAPVKPYLPDFAQLFSNEIMVHVNKVARESVPFMRNLMGHVAMLFLMPLIVFYILMDADTYRSSFMSIIPAKKKPEIEELMKEIDLILQRYVRGQILVCIIIGISVAVVLIVMDIPYAILIGVFAGIIDAIPYVGVIVGMIPAVALALLKSPLHAILVLLVLYVVHWSEGHIVIPNIMGQSVGLPPLTVIVALIIGAQLMGVLGMFLSVPLASVIRVVISFYVRKRQEKEAAENLSPPAI